MPLQQAGDHCTPIRMAKIWSSWQHQMLVRTWSHRNAHAGPVGMQNGVPLWKTVQWFLEELNILLPSIPGTVLLAICPKRMGTYVHTSQHADGGSRFLHNWRNLEATEMPFSRWWIRKQWSIWTMGYYLGVKRNELSSHEKTWRKPKCMFLTERSQS